MVIKRRFKKESEKKSPRDRLDVLLVAIFIFAAILSMRLIDIQIFQHGFYEALAANQHELYEKLLPKRGEILVHDPDNAGKYYPLATNKINYLIYAEPKRVTSPGTAARELAPLLELEEAEILPRLEKEGDLYEPLKHDVPEEIKNKISALNLTGIKFQEELSRYYPDKNIGAHLLGFVGWQDDVRAGRYGLEEYWNKELAGESGFLQAEKDAQGRWITFGTKLFQEAKDGDNLVLTIDRTIQYEACTTLNEAVQKHGADGGSVIIMDPATGAVIAMCGAPDFDLNNYREVEEVNTFINPATFYIYEPGSVFKPITMAAALDQGKVTPATTYEDTGAEKIGKYTIKNSDSKTHGVQTMTQVLEQSLNTGAIFVARQVGPEIFEEYVKKFGFGQKYGLELSSEAQGNISLLAGQKELNMATASFGQGIAVTLLQMTNAFGAIANNGNLMEPYVVDEIQKPDGQMIKTEPRVIRQVVSSKTATTLGAMLVNVVQNGHGQRAGVPGYYVAGKTGTAQIPREDGPGYDPDHTIGSFCGFAPVDNPRFVMCVKLDRPRDVQWAESTAAPIFGYLAQFMLNYYGVPPEEEVK